MSDSKIFMSEPELAWEFIEDNADEFALLLLLESDEESTERFKNLRVRFKNQASKSAAPIMLKVITKSGSIYLLSKENLTWERIPSEKDPERDNPLIINKGTLAYFPLNIKIGERISIVGWEDVNECLRLFGELHKTEYERRLFISTPIVEIEEIESK